MAGVLITIEGSDASGKATQTEMLHEVLVDSGFPVKKVTFPDYESESSALVKMYLHGSFGEDPEDVNPYVASTFFAVDRFASYRMKWRKFYQEGGIIIADRYTTANMIHQAAKYTLLEERQKFLDWLWHFEFQLYELPIPDLVIFLDVPPELSRRLMQDRENKITGLEEKDIHEKNKNFMVRSYKNSLAMAEKYGWQIIDCVDELGNLLSKKAIHDKIYRAVRQII